MSIDGTHDNIWIMNRNNNYKKKINITKTEAPSFTIPVLIDNYVLWIEEEKIVNGKIKGSIKQYNCLTDDVNIIQHLNEIGMHNFRLENYNTKIIWADKLNGESYYFVYDIFTKTKTKIQSNLDYPSHPILIERYIISNEFSNDSNGIQSYIYDTYTKKSNKIDIKLNGYYAYNNYLITNNGKDVFICQVNEDLNVHKVNTIKNENYEDYYVSSNQSLIFMKQNTNNNFDLLIYKKN